MTVLPMRKVSIVAQAKDRECLMSTLQKAGVLHITPLTSNDGLFEHEEALKSHLAKVDKTIEFLAKFQAVPGSVPKRSSDDDTLVDTVSQLCAQCEQCEGEIAELRRSIELYAPFGEFSHSEQPLVEAGLTIRLARIGDDELRHLARLCGSFQVIRRVNERNYVAIVSPKPIDMPFETFAYPTKSITAFKRELSCLSERLRSLQKEASAWGYQLHHLEHIKRELEEKLDCVRESKKTLITHNLVGISGFVLQQKTDELKKALHKHVLAIRIDEPSRDLDVPVQLKNPKVVAGFEAIVKAFTGINYFEKDKTVLISLLFVVFGALCLLDAGYGLLLFIAGYVLAIKKHRDFGQVFMWTGLFSTVLGLLCGQVFGLVFAKDILFNIPPLLTLATDPMVCFKFSLLVGLCAMATSNITALFQSGIRCHALGSLCLILCGMALIIKHSELLHGQFFDPSLILDWVAISLGGLCLLSWVLFPDPVFGNAHIANVLWMFYSGPIGLVQDILSHMRLFGIALSGSILALVINKIAAILPAVIGTLFAPFGHFLVFLLSLLSLYIHSNRLVFLEFGSKCMNGGSNYFKPFARRST